MVKHEEPEMIVLAQYLDLLGVLWAHVPNEGQHKIQYMHKRSVLGVKPGVPDVLIFECPPALPNRIGVAVELKRPDGKGVVSVRQQEWLDALGKRGWISFVADGARPAIDYLTELGFRTGGTACKALRAGG